MGVPTDPDGPLVPTGLWSPKSPSIPRSLCHPGALIRMAVGPSVAGQQRHRDGPPVPPRLFRTLYPQQTRHGHGPPQPSARDKAVARPACPQPVGLGHLNTTSRPQIPLPEAAWQPHPSGETEAGLEFACGPSGAWTGTSCTHHQLPIPREVPPVPPQVSLHCPSRVGIPCPVADADLGGIWDLEGPCCSRGAGSRPEHTH